jgi:tetratricopeptide (TPR) repeat protein
LSDRLAAEGANTIVHTLPIDLDAREIDRAQELARRLHAEAVVISHPDTRDGVTSYVGFVVLADSSPSKVVVLPNSLAAAIGGDAFTGARSAVVEDRIAVPVLHAGSPERLAIAISGVLAYEQDDYDQAIDDLSEALPEDRTAADAAVTNLYLADSLRLSGRDHDGATAYSNAVNGFKQSDAKGQLGPRDELSSVKCYIALGDIAAAGGDGDQAIVWYQEEVAHWTSLLARQNDLSESAEFRSTYVMLYDRLAIPYRAKGIGEEERWWQKRSEEEANEYLAITGSSVVIDQRDQTDGTAFSADQFLAISPTDPTAVLIAAASYASSLHDFSPFASGDHGADSRAIVESTSSVLVEGAGATRVERLAAWSLQIQTTRTLWRLTPSDQSLRDAYKEGVDHALAEAIVRDPSTRFEQSLAENILAVTEAFYSTVAHDSNTAADVSDELFEITTSSPTDRLPPVTPSSIDCDERLLGRTAVRPGAQSTRYAICNCRIGPRAHSCAPLQDVQPRHASGWESDIDHSHETINSSRGRRSRRTGSLAA